MSDTKKLLLMKAHRYLVLPEPDEQISIRDRYLLPTDTKSLPNEFRVLEEQRVKKQTNIPKAEFVSVVIRIASLLDKESVFHTLNPSHLELAKSLFNIFYRVWLEDLITAIEYARKYINRYLFQYVLSVTLRHRPDLKGLSFTPAHITLAPHLYFDLSDLFIKKSGVQDGKIILRGKFDYDQNSVDLEQRLEYFRCDPGLNAHHRHWHEAYLDAPGFQGVGNERRDRAGELFFYMHSQMVARYNFERLSVNVPFTEPLANLREPLAEPYFNRLTTENKAKLWDSRPPNQKLTDIDVNGTSLRIQDMELRRSRIYDAIDRGVVHIKSEDSPIERTAPLNDDLNDKEVKDGIPRDTGIDKLGSLVWALSQRSVNPGFYGQVGLHNEGHLIIGYSHDPIGLYYKQSQGGAMTMQETASRDPAFYRWHQFVDEIFQRYKATLAPYRIEELEFEKIKITSFETVSNGEKNVLTTKWVEDRVNITEGVAEFKKKLLNVKKVYYDFTHLAHEKFTYNIKVHNKHSAPKLGVVRIYIAPRFTDLKYKEMLYRQGKDAEDAARKVNPHLEPSFNKLRKMFIELDKFVVKLQPGENKIERSSEKSSVTIPLKQLFMTLEDALNYVEKPKAALETLSWCGCGWPDYMLIGRGTKDGLSCHLFVMISDFEKDKVCEDSAHCSGESESYENLMSYCGIRDKLYPDRKPMGYPFDRNVQSEDILFRDFVTKTRNPLDPVKIENMDFVEVKVKHREMKEPEKGPTIIPAPSR